MMTTKTAEDPTLHRADEPTSAMVPHSTALHYLVIGRRRDYEGIPWIEFETEILTDANKKCAELNVSDQVNQFKIETWSPPRRR